jgi:hypothetical protein
MELVSADRQKHPQITQIPQISKNPQLIAILNQLSSKRIPCNLWIRFQVNYFNAAILVCG